MKTAEDPRHLKRIHLMQLLFTWNFQESKTDPEILDITKNLAKIEENIKVAAPDRPLSQINKIDLAILRLSVYELLLIKDTPLRVVVDEAVELAKEYGSESSPSFVNGVLGKVIERNKIKK
jgi:transcription antitermination factor NusB